MKVVNICKKKYCDKCGNLIKINDDYCDKCGFSVNHIDDLTYIKLTKKDRIKSNIMLIGIISSIFLLITFITLFIVDRLAILKRCNDGDKKVGSICISEHKSEPLQSYNCGVGQYLKDGKCYSTLSIYEGYGTSAERIKYCSNGYLEGTGIMAKCIYEVIYDAYY